MKAYRVLSPFANLLVALVVVGVADGCSGGGGGDASPNAGLPSQTRPEGVPATPFWYAINDSVFWYQAQDSLALAQMRLQTTPRQKTASLFALRDLGWRLTVERGPGMQRTGEPQALEQRVFSVARQAGAVSVSGDSRLEVLYRRDADGVPPALAGLLPGLQQYGTGSTLYFWPAAVAIVWSPLITALQADSLLDSLGCTTLTDPQLTYQYYIQRGWAIALPAGSDLFAWLRMFNADPRVVLAHPVAALRDPPAADYRLIRRLPGKPIDEPEGFYKLSHQLQNAYYIAHFSGSTMQVQATVAIGIDGSRFRVEIMPNHADPVADSQRVAGVGGDVIRINRYGVTAWIPFESLPRLAADSTVQKLAMVKAEK